jgi:hypothetical protein
MQYLENYRYFLFAFRNAFEKSLSEKKLRKENN